MRIYLCVGFFHGCTDLFSLRVFPHVGAFVSKDASSLCKTDSRYFTKIKILFYKYVHRHKRCYPLYCLYKGQLYTFAYFYTWGRHRIKLINTKYDYYYFLSSDTKNLSKSKNYFDVQVSRRNLLLFIFTIFF